MVQTPITEIVYDVIKHRIPGIGLSDFECIFARFTFHPVQHAGETVGAILQDGPEMHAVIQPEFRGRWAGKPELALLHSALDEYGEVLSAVMNEHAQGHRFAHRLGFQEIAKDGTMTHYRMTKQ